MKPDPDTPTPSASIFGRLTWLAGRTEDGILALALLLMALIPVIELVGRTWFGIGIRCNRISPASHTVDRVSGRHARHTGKQTP